MSKPGFTRGPWSLDARQWDGVHWDTVLRNNSRDPIALIKAAGWDAPTHWANAHLIEAAPDLYEALGHAASAIERLRGVLSLAINGHPVRDLAETYAEADAALGVIRAALAKADGQGEES